MLRQCNTVNGNDSALPQEKLLDGGRVLSSNAVADLLIRVYLEYGKVSEATKVLIAWCLTVKLNVLSCNGLMTTLLMF